MYKIVETKAQFIYSSGVIKKVLQCNAQYWQISQSLHSSAWRGWLDFVFELL